MADGFPFPLERMEEDLMLMDAFKAVCVRMVEGKAPDGEGGWKAVWVEGAEFEASITHTNTTEAKAAEKQDAFSRYSVYTDKSTLLKYHEVFKRRSDGKIFRVTSDGDDIQTPKSATFQFSQVTAEEYTLPDIGGEAS